MASSSSSSSSPIILFYGKQCQHSIKFISALDKLGLRKYFQFVCVDKNKAGQRPPVVSKFGIREIPTVIVKNQKISGQLAFTWLSEEVKKFKGKQSVHSTGSQPQLRQQRQYGQQQEQSSCTLEPVDIFSGGTSLLGGSSFVYIDGSSDTNQSPPSTRFAIAGSRQSMTETLPEDQSFVKPENHFIVPTGLSPTTEAIIASGSGVATSEKEPKRSTKRIDKDLAQLIEDRKRIIRPGSQTLMQM